MKIDRVTITGVDSNTNLLTIHNLQRDYPFVEWGILFASVDSNRPKYPSSNYREKLIGTELNLSAHFCGKWSQEVLEKRQFDLITDLPAEFKRVQLNYNFSRNTMWEMTPLLEYAKEHPERSIILQYNKANSTAIGIIPEKAFPSNIHFLYDSSGGRGTVISEISGPLKNHYTGYSGGIGPETINGVLYGINNRSEDINVWIDMESKVRTENMLDLLLVKEILIKVANAISKE